MTSQKQLRRRLPFGVSIIILECFPGWMLVQNSFTGLLPNENSQRIISVRVNQKFFKIDSLIS